MHTFGALLIPELRWDCIHGFSQLQPRIDEALALGVGGFVIANGPSPRVAELTTALQRASRHPLLIAAPAACGAATALDGATGLPPMAALGALHDEDVIRRAARLTARELRVAGVTWALAPAADLAVEPLNPFLGARALHHDPQRVAEWVVAWVDACQAEGVLATALHLPGEGRALVDASLDTSVVDAPGAGLWATDLVPFRAAVDAGVATVLASAVTYPRLDASRVPAACSRVILRELMRDELQFEGLLVAPPPLTAALRGLGDEGNVAAQMLAAGCDLILAPQDLRGVHEGIMRAVDAGTLRWEDLEASLQRRTFWARWGRGDALREPTLDDVLWARKVSDTVVHAPRGVFANVGPVMDVILVDDDAPDAAPDAADDATRFAPFLATLRAVGLGPRVVMGPTDDGRGAVCIAVRGAPAAGRGRAGYHAATRARVAALLQAARAARRPVVAVLFGPPALADDLPDVPNVICAWSGNRAMQEAAARRLA
jgi:beta-glucosidase-like glycosyl hydrolase